jgi:hypothetical protein
MLYVVEVPVLMSMLRSGHDTEYAVARSGQLEVC